MDLNPFSSQTRASGVPMMGVRGPVVDTTQHNNPFGGPSAGSSPAPPTLTPVKTLATLVEEWITLPGPCLGVMVGLEGGLPLPLPLRLLTQTQWTPGPPLPPLPSTPTLPTLEEAVSWARLQQWQRLLVSVPPAGQLLPPPTQPLTPATLGLLRCRWAALGGTRRWLAGVEEGVSVLAALVARGGGEDGNISGPLTITPTIAVWLCLLAEALRSCALWREAVFVSHGVIRALGLPTPAPPSPMGGGAGASGWAVKLEGGGGGGGASATAALGGGDGGVGGAAATTTTITTTTTIPGAALVVDSALALLFKGASQVPHRVASRLILIAGGVCCSALSGSGFGLGAANAASDTASATASRMNPPPNTPPTPVDPTITTATAATGSGSATDGAINWALEPPPEWLTAGLALLGVARSHRSIGRDTEASVALTSLFAITQWRAAGDLLMGAVGGSVGSKDLSNLSPHTAYVAGVLGCYRGDEALAQGRFAEALPLFEASLIALSSRFLPPPSSPSSPAAAAAAAGASGAAFPPITTLLAASSSIVSTVGGLSLLPARPSNLAAIPLPSGFLPDPCDLLVDAVVGVAEAVRKLPPPATGPTIFPNHLSILILEATLKCAPAVVLRAGVCAYLNALYDAGKQPMDAAAAKRLLAAISQAYGVLV